MRVRANATGEIGLQFHELQAASWSDGWSPSNSASRGIRRSRVNSAGKLWVRFNGWPGTNDPAFALTPQGNGLYTGAFTFNTPGNFAFKFRHLDATNPWNISIGDNFGNNAGNTPLSRSPIRASCGISSSICRTAGGGPTWTAAVLRAGVVPEPGSLAIVLVGLARRRGGCCRRR